MTHPEGSPRSAESRIAKDALTFDDVLIAPRRSSVLPDLVDVSTQLTRNIRLNIPLVSAPMTR